MSKPDKSASGGKRKLHRGQLGYLIVASGLVLILGCTAAFSFYYRGRILPRSEVSGIKLGGLTQAEAVLRLTEQTDSYKNATLTLVGGEQSFQYKPADYGTTFASAEAVSTLWDMEKSGSWKEQLGELLLAPFQTKRVEVGYRLFDEAGLIKWKTELLKGLETAHQETGLSLLPGKVEIVPGKAGTKIDQNQFERDFFSSFKQGSSQIALSLVPFNPELSSEMAQSAKEQASALLGGNWQVELPGGSRPELAAAELAKWLGTAVERPAVGASATGLGLTLDAEKVKSAVTAWGKSVTKKATNPSLGVVEGKVQIVEEGVAGADLDVDASINTLTAALMAYGKVGSTTTSKLVKLVGKTVLPEVRKDNLANLGLVELIGSATTDYSGSPTNRKYNIGVGQRSLNKDLIAPSEVYSTTGTLGPISTETGYLNELVIKNNRTTPEAGGGLCQVSTTLFRAVLNAGLPVVARTNHAYRVSYYERVVGPGLDATIYDPNPDFKWRNDLPTSIYIQSSIKGNTITFDLYGTSDGRRSSVSSPTILETYPVGSPISLETDTLYVGERKQVETAHDGAKTVVTYTVTRDGKEINKQTFYSVYKAWPAQFLVGTKPKPETTPTPTPEPTPTPTPTPTPELSPAP